EDLAVGTERDDALLDARATGVVDADHRAAHARGEVHQLADLLAHHLAERAAEDGEVLAEHADLAPVDRAVAGDHRVGQRARAVHLKVGRAVAHETVELMEGLRIEQLLDPLTRGVLALRVLLLDSRTLGVRGFAAKLLQLLETL